MAYYIYKIWSSLENIPIYVGYMGNITEKAKTSTMKGRTPWNKGLKLKR